ncbi:ATP11, putative, partial [Rhizoctonia solani AG-3 Rhs1AP]
MNGKTTKINEVFPRPKKLSNPSSRVYTMRDGYQFQWKGLDMIYAVNVKTDLNVATYYQNKMYLINDKKSALDIAAGASTELTDALVVTWALYEKKARDWRRSRY